MTDRKTRRLPAAKLIAIAALGGLIAGAAAVYVKAVGSGNGGDAAVAAVKGCEGAKNRAAALIPLSKGQVAAMTQVDRPRKLDMLAFNGPAGKPMSLADFSGKTVLLNLWATWCVPCREEMPALNALQQDLGGDRFEVVAVNIDTGGDEKPRAFLEETGVRALGYYRDNTIAVFNDLKKEGLAFGLPVTLLLDDKGCLLSAMNGPAAWDSPDAKALIQAAIAANVPG